jgi:5-methylcytosine-specific restriction protein B
VLSDLSVLKSAAIANTQTNFEKELVITKDNSQKIEAEYRKLFPDNSIKISGSTLRYDNKSDKSKALTAYLPFQWLFRVHQCKELIEALKIYAQHVDAFKSIINDDALMRVLPKVDWESALPLEAVTKINEFIDNHFEDEHDKSLFRVFLDGRSWLDLKHGDATELTGKKLNRATKDYIGSVIASTTRLINDTAGAMPQFIELYTLSGVVRDILAKSSFPPNPASDTALEGGKNIIYYGAPGTGKSHTINESIVEEYTARTVFHADTQNSDFLGCLKPKMQGDSIRYEFRSGPFTNAIIKAFQEPSEQHWLVIEEINRAPAAAVFGEIFQLLDREPNGESTYSINLSDLDMIQHIESETGLALDKGMLKIPSNLSLLATMNSSDQAVMPLDTAFKRRWNFRYIPLDFDNSYTKSGKACSDGVLFIQDETSIDEAPQEKQISWKDFAVAINEILTENGIPEDKHLGPFFLSNNELTTKNRSESLTGKLFMYLWDDVLRHGMSDLVFSSEINTYGQLIRHYQSKKPVFSGQFYDLVKEQLQPTEEEGIAKEDGNDNE